MIHYKGYEFYQSKVNKDLNEFRQISDLIVSNRHRKDVFDVKEKVYTRDIFNMD